MKFQTDRQKIILLIRVVALLILFVLIGVIGIFQPPFSDDFLTMLDVKEHGIFSGTIWVYKNWGGNISTYFITYVVESGFLAFTLTGILSSILFFSLAYLLCLIAIGNKPKIFTNDFFLFVLCVFILWFMPCGLSDVLFWRSGIHYITGSISVLLFILPFSFFYRDISLNKWFKFLLPLIGIVTGLFTLQYSSTALIYIGFFILLVYFFKKVRLPFYLILGILGLFVGVTIDLLSPGNYVRLGEYDFSISVFFHMIMNFFQSDFLYSSIYIFILLLIVLLVNNYSVKFIKITTLNIVLAPLSLSIFILVPSVQIRYFWLFYVFIILYFLSLVDYKTYLSFNKANWFKIIPVVLFFVLIFHLYADVKNSIWVYKQHINREQIIQTAKREGKTKVEVPSIINRNNRVTLVNNYYDFEDPESWVRKAFQKYYKVDSIYTIPGNKFRSPGMGKVFQYIKQNSFE